jgi:hypothetical protein
MADKKDLFSDDYAAAVSYPYFNPKNIGDAVRGYIVGYQEREDMHNNTLRQKVYILEVPEGETYEATKKAGEPVVKIKGGERLSVYGRFTQDNGVADLKVIDEFETLPLGQLVGVQYDRDRTSAAGKEYKNWKVFVYSEVKDGVTVAPGMAAPSDLAAKMADQPF